MVEEDDELKDLFPGSSVSKSADQILDDPDLYGILVSVYEKSDRTGRATKLRRNATKTDRAKQKDTLRSFLSSDKNARREFAVQARKFLSERNAGDAVEQQRLSLGGKGSSRTSSIIRAAQSATPNTTALGRTSLSAGAGRVQSILGQMGALG